VGLRARRTGRRFDEERGCYVYDVRFKTRAPVSERTVEVARAFGLGVDDEREHVVYRDFEVRLSEGDVVYITGDSGSGKSVLLRALREDLGEEAVDIDDVDAPAGRPIIDTVGGTFRDALRLLSRVGLNDAFLFLREYGQLSDGQRYRYRIARMIDSGRKYWLADEFCSTLDRTTARIVAYNIQKLARRSGATLIAATTHVDLEEDLSPSILIRKGWGDEIHVEYRANSEAPECSVSREVALREATKKDYDRLAYLHYRDHRVRVPIRFFALERIGELVGVIAYCYPGVFAGGRRKAVGRKVTVSELNRDWAVISRVIVHPKYRTMGLGRRLVRGTLPLCGRRHVEMVAVMAQYNPFAERAGMCLVSVNEPHHSILKAVEVLRGLGFDPLRIASEAYNLEVLHELGEPGITPVRDTLSRVSSGYNKRIARKSQPYMRKAEYHEWLEEQGAESLAKAISTLSILSQTKAYLYWCRDSGEGGG